MRRIALLLALSIAATGCVTQKRCNMKFPPSIVERVDSVVVEKEVVRDTTVYIYLPQDTIIKHDTVVVTKQGANSKPVVTEGRWSKAVAQVVNGLLTQTLYEGTADSIAITLNGVIRERDYYKELSSYREETRIEYQNTKFANFTIWFFWAFVAVVIVLLLVFRVRIEKHITV